MPNQEFTIGLFDSGVGGLSVLRQLERVVSQYPQYPAYRFLYLGDTARCPYGGRDPQTITRFALEISQWLKSQGADCLVMACNTSAACAGMAARANSSLPVYDLIQSTAEHIAAKGCKTAVLATVGTVKSGAFSQAIWAKNPQVQVMEIACPDLVPLVEKGLLDVPETQDALRRYVQDFSEQGVEAVVLGCTHYPFLKKTLSRLLPGVELIDPAEQLAEMLISQPTGVDIKPVVKKEFFVTGSPEAFVSVAQVCLGQQLGTVHGISLEALETPIAGWPASPVVSFPSVPVFDSSSRIP